MIDSVFGAHSNVAQAADRCKVKWFAMISSDKAVNPLNAMGMSKGVVEMVVQAVRAYDGTNLMSLRFENALGSHGSAAFAFPRQISEGGPVTVAHPDITRYFMDAFGAVQLEIQARV